MQKLIITVAPTGNVPTREMNPSLPVTPEEILETALRCRQAGASLIHIHARDDTSGQETHKEDFTTAAAAAIHGGVVHVADMPNNPAAPVDDASYAAKREHLASRHVPIPVTLYAGIGPGTQPLSFAVPYKAYMGPSVGDLFFTTLNDLDETLARYQGRAVSFHCEDPALLDAHRKAARHEAFARPRPMRRSSVSERLMKGGRKECCSPRGSRSCGSRHRATAQRRGVESRGPGFAVHPSRAARSPPVMSTAISKPFDRISL